MDYIIKIKHAEDLPIATQKEFNVFSGLVEIRIKKHPYEIISITKIGRFSDRFREVLKEEGLLGAIVFPEDDKGDIIDDPMKAISKLSDEENKRTEGNKP